LKALFLTRYGRLAPSSRQRCFLYLDALGAAGIDAEVSPFLGDGYVRRLYAGRAANITGLCRAYASRLLALLRARRYDLLWVEKEALPWLPAWIELALLRTVGAPTVIDCDDAVFHNYDQHGNRLVRRALRHKIDQVMAAADLVTVGNAYLGRRARAAGARTVSELPTVVDLRRYPEHGAAPAAEPFKLGWIGSPVTTAYLEQLRPALRELAAQISFRVILIGAAPGSLPGLPVEHVVWSPETEAAELARCDVGLMPLPDLPWERGKCGYKLIQYMASALPVVASPVGANREIVVPGETGFLAETDADWIASLSRLAQDPELRRRMGAAGRRRVTEHYSLEVAAPN